MNREPHLIMTIAVLSLAAIFVWFGLKTLIAGLVIGALIDLFVN